MKSIAIYVRLPESLSGQGVHVETFDVTEEHNAVSELTLLDRIDQLTQSRDAPRLRVHSGIRASSRERDIREARFRDGDIVTLEWDLQGLLGGKGGFGAGLRAMGKTAAAKQKPSNDFSLCRDLSGNRLGAINTGLLIDQAKQREAALGATGAKGAAAVAVDADQWLLERPTWVEGSHKRPVEDKEDDKRKRIPHRGEAASKRPQRVDAAAAFEKSLQEEFEKTDESIASSVVEGLMHRKRSKLAAENQNSVNKEDVSEPILPAPEGAKVVSGKAIVILTESPHDVIYTVTGASDFPTVTFPGFTNLDYEATIKTNGLIQVGFSGSSASSLTGSMEDNLDGIGDVEDTIAVDLVRNLVWTNGASSALACIEVIVNPTESIIEGRLGTAATEDTRVSFRVNGSSVKVDTFEASKSQKYVPAVSLEKGEVVQLRFLKAVSSSSASSSSSSETVSVTVEELEKLGAKALGDELKNLGLKYGGTIAERAKRVLIARTVPREDWPKSLFPN